MCDSLGWEYIKFHRPNIDDLNQLGKHGWELVCYRPDGDTAILKRAKRQAYEIESGTINDKWLQTVVKEDFARYAERVDRYVDRLYPGKGMYRKYAAWEREDSDPEDFTDEDRIFDYPDETERRSKDDE